tara:strand:- start:17234 stop:17548 length:315 start_codon:yes stop_codon:yes gene_type:complete
MAYKGTAAKSASGASMSKYDVEVEARLKKLEAGAHQHADDAAAKVEERLAALEAKAHTPCGGGGKGAKLDAAALPAVAPRKTTPAQGRIDALEARLEALIAQLS